MVVVTVRAERACREFETRAATRDISKQRGAPPPRRLAAPPRMAPRSRTGKPLCHHESDVTAGLKCAPEMPPSTDIAIASDRTERDRHFKHAPACWTAAAFSTALPQPTNTTQAVPALSTNNRLPQACHSDSRICAMRRRRPACDGELSLLRHSHIDVHNEALTGLVRSRSGPSATAIVGLIWRDVNRTILKSGGSAREANKPLCGVSSQASSQADLPRILDQIGFRIEPELPHRVALLRADRLVAAVEPLGNLANRHSLDVEPEPRPTRAHSTRRRLVGDTWRLRSPRARGPKDSGGRHRRRRLRHQRTGGIALVDDCGHAHMKQCRNVRG